MKISIKWMLIGGVIGLQVISVSVILASSYLTSQHVLLRHAKDIMKNIATFTVHEAQSYLSPAQDAAQLTKRLADRSVVTGEDQARLESYFYEQLRLHSNFAGIYLGGPSGDFLYVSRSNSRAMGGFRTKIITIREGVKITELIWKDAHQKEIMREFDPHDTYDPTLRPWYIKASEKHTTIWTDPYIFFTSKQPGLTVASPVFDATGETAGVVGVDIEIGAISTFLSQLQVGKQGLAFILNKNGDVVAFPNLSKIKWPAENAQGQFRLTKINELDDILCRKAFESLKRPVGSFDIQNPVFGSFRHGNQNYHTMFAPFTNPRWPWIIGIYLPEDDYLGPIKQNRLNNIYIMLGIAVAGILVGFLIVRSIVKPMTALQLEANAVKDYDLETTFNKNSVIKEIQDTADYFTRMKGGLKAFKQKNIELTQGLQERAEELQLKEMRLRATFTSLINFTDALIVLDENHSMRFLNPAADRLLRGTAAQLLGQPFKFPVVEQKTTEIVIDSSSAEPVIAEMRVVDTEWEGSAAHLVALRDITERKQMEAEIRWRANTLEALHETAVDLASQEALPQLLRAIAERAVNLLQAKGAGIFLHRPEKNVLESVLWYNLTPDITGTLVRRGEGVAGKVLETGQPIVLPDCNKRENQEMQGQDCNYQSCCALPILWGQRILGILMIGDDAPRKNSASDIALLERFTPLAAAALEQRRLLEEAEILYSQAQQDAQTKSVLLKEVNHRVQNNLSAIIGMLYAERRHSSTGVAPFYLAALNDLINRIQGLATVHTLLSASKWRPLLLSDLAEKIIHASLQALPVHKRFAIKVEPSALRVPSVQANNLAMVINELSTNTLKYALPQRNKGQITVTIATDEGQDQVRLEYRDDGPGYPPDVLKMERSSTGMYLIQNIVTRDLRGKLKIFNDLGAVTLIHFPVTADSRESRYA
jgi:two-component sensor histidine kinase